MKSKILAAGLLGLCASFSGCMSQGSNAMVDLNKVLDALVAVLDESGQASAGSAGTTSDGTAGTGATIAIDGATESVEGVAQVGSPPIDPAKEQAFLDSYAKKLNEVKALENGTLGVAIQPGGEIVGFQDHNANNVQDAGETKEFTVTVDPENSRLVASDNNGNHRPHSYFPGSGFLMGYMMSSMLGRQSSFYSGANAGAKPNFSNSQMSSPDYHKKAVQSARASAAPSARARTGSRGFSFGK